MNLPVSDTHAVQPEASLAKMPKARERSRAKRVVVEGVGDSSSGGGAVMAGRDWRGVVFFRPWRLLADGAPSKELLRVLLPARPTSGEASRASKKVKTGDVYRFTATMLPRSPGMLASAELHGVLERVVASDGLVEADAEVSMTLRVKDPVLGVLVRRPRREEYEGRLKLYGRTVPLVVEGSIERASALFARAIPRLVEVPPFIARKLLRLANETWLDVPISESRLRQRLKPTEVWIDSSALRLSFSCGDTFGDHGVTATLTARGAIKDIRLQ